MELLEQAPENALGDEDRWHEKIMPIGLLEGVVLKPSLSAPGQSLRQEYSGEWSNDSQKPIRDAPEELPKDGYSGEWSPPGWQKLGVTPTAVSFNSWILGCAVERKGLASHKKRESTVCPTFPSRNSPETILQSHA